jgi:DNA polymerase III subunit delta'
MTDSQQIQQSAPGCNRLVGQEQVREKLRRIIQEGRIGHAYLFSGPPGCGKKALALAFAEAVNGVENLGIPAGGRTSHRRSWYFHPDIRVYIPLPVNVSKSERQSRMELLAGDPYEIVDFATRPSITGDEETKNRRAMYSVDYFNTEIRRTASLKPAEGNRNIIIITDIEQMSDRVVNAFLKLLEEPGDKVTFILTTNNINALLPTLVSRCHILSCRPLEAGEIYEGLRKFDGVPDDQARFFRVSPEAITVKPVFYDRETLQENREDIIRFLRMSYSLDAGKILEISQKWQTEYNKEGQFAIISMIESFLRDIAMHSSGIDESLITNSDRLDVIENFCSHLRDARIEEMIKHWKKHALC